MNIICKTTKSFLLKLFEFKLSRILYLKLILHRNLIFILFLRKYIEFLQLFINWVNHWSSFNWKSILLAKIKLIVVFLLDKTRIIGLILIIIWFKAILTGYSACAGILFIYYRLFLLFHNWNMACFVIIQSHKRW